MVSAAAHWSRRPLPLPGDGRVEVRAQPVYSLHVAVIRLVGVNTSVSTSNVIIIIIINVLIIVRLNKSMTKFVANACSPRF